MNLKKNWWKILSVILIAYSIIAGLLIPLKPGIIDVHKKKIRVSTNVWLNVTGYNSRYMEAEGSIRAWLKLDEAYALAAHKVEVVSDRELKLNFRIAQDVPGTDTLFGLALIIDSPVDGATVLPSAVFLHQDRPDTGEDHVIWSKDPIVDLHEYPGFTFPFRNILGETIRNTFFHVPMWFVMFFILLLSFLSFF